MRQYTLASITLKTAIVHTVTYFLIGLLAFTFFDYSGKYADPIIATLMRQTDDPLVGAGPLFQVLRGALFGLAFYPSYYWVTHPEHKWLTWVFGAAFALVVLLATMGVLAALGILAVPAQ